MEPQEDWFGTLYGDIIEYTSIAVEFGVTGMWFVHIYINFPQFPPSFKLKFDSRKSCKSKVSTPAIWSNVL